MPFAGLPTFFQRLLHLRRAGASFESPRYLLKWLLISTAIGLVAGAGALLFFEAIRLSTGFFLGTLVGYLPPDPAGEGTMGVMLMVAEMTGNLSMLAPAMIAVGISSIIVGNHTIYTSQVGSRADSPAHRLQLSFPLLSTLVVRQAMTPPPLRFSPQQSVAEAEQLLAERVVGGGSVLDARGNLLGVLTLADIERIPAASRGSRRVEEAMNRAVLVAQPDDTLDVALEQLTSHRHGSLVTRCERRTSRRRAWWSRSAARTSCSSPGAAPSSKRSAPRPSSSWYAWDRACLPARSTALSPAADAPVWGSCLSAPPGLARLPCQSPGGHQACPARAPPQLQQRHR